MRSVERNYQRCSQLIAKRVFDVAVSTIVLFLFSPLFLLVLLTIRLGTSGPIFSVEHAYSCTSQPIRVLRFRIRDHGLRPFLTRSGLDQLPMLINVLRGEMSIVGPHRYVFPLGTPMIPWRQHSWTLLFCQVLSTLIYWAARRPIWTRICSTC